MAIAQTTQVLNIDITSSAGDTSPIIFQQTTNIDHLHYISTRTLLEPQIMSYGGATKNGVRLIKTQVLDSVLTWMHFLMTNYRTLMEFLTSIEHIKNVTYVLDAYRIFKRGNAADSKRNWFEFTSGKRPHVYDEFI